MYRWEITRTVLAQRLVAVVRDETYDRAVTRAETLLSAGVTAVEVSLTTPGALDALTTLARPPRGEAVVGAGTVLDAASARAAVDAGAQFLVSPALQPEVIRTGHRLGVPVIPGVATPTEIVHALELGADALKVFPVSGRSPRWLADLRAALPQAPLVPTGGVTVEEAPAWIAAGAVACGMGAALTAGDPSEIRGRVGGLLRALAAAAPRGETPAGDGAGEGA
ncbi:bifunctional 4-hydroxy-2-oxoglutarate aldolase/2-dehydro-3-deoxy-phosphogluconate aldolase [Streptomyces zingiberis]|uniref:Bifunctional 4-hydroxy-2-oxoglutarate aldolase/2-dehydro-3-deoxy-phosphogluconate aldolase n=1 Tax=Streptomyces zingiberis TaxID=2053010 RepID=A0ABX1C564_9ACTN|nr:bifunctional 4-hydroxy-2-oxoglutarate aldolase/2-dehydro-3-deoxy-phosphogluconate aldolase [Streptomyces zingiberis]NJQ02799.1 bifunctional 4-hydroxy-2-oxoglutarate aldolase/2-dehydro-3-deoxy-phosphogluconate aldolase [Streptomyces zingiberis]